MALVVEDGTGLTNADALTSLVAFKAYADAMGWDHSAFSDDALEQAIRRASAFLTHGFAYAGYKTNMRAQSMAFPRVGLYDREGNYVASDAVPVEIVYATHEVTWREAQSPGSMTPDTVPAEQIKRIKASSVEIEYANAAVGPEASRPVILRLGDLLAPFLTFGGGSQLAGRAERV